MSRFGELARKAAGRGVSAAVKDAGRLARTGGKVARASGRAGYRAAATERCPHCGERSRASYDVCPHCRRTKHDPLS